MTKRERYKRLFEKYCIDNSYGRGTYQQFKKRVRMLNRHYAKYIIAGVLIMMCNNAMAREIDTIIIHHTGESNRDMSAKQIDKYHRQRGWMCIGYHYVIRRRGWYEVGRPECEVGAHARGRNQTSIGIALSGRDATQEQKNTLIELIRKLVKKYKITKIERHHEECPGQSVHVEQLHERFCK